MMQWNINKSLFLISLSILTAFMLYKEFFSYSDHRECEIKEIQKLAYKPSYAESSKIQLYCELKFPYEKEIYGPTISSWQGTLIKINNDSDAYRITKVKIYATKGDCEHKMSEVKPLIYYVSDGIDGATFDWSDEYKCHLTEKTQFWGKIRKESFQ